MRNARDVFIAGLRDAHAMEQQAKDMMESVSNRLDDFPEFASRAAEHARETEEQIERLRHCLDMIGEQPSMLKDLGTRTMANLQGLMHASTSDEVIKDMLTGFAFENFEIASYRSLIAFARELGEDRMIPLLEDSLREEEAMASWVGDRIETVTEQFCRMAEASAE